MVRPQAAAGQVTLRTRIEPTLPVLRTDERILRQIVLNLLTNAIKFTPVGGNGAVLGGTGERRPAVDCRGDSGVGMAESEIDLALMPFRQIDSTLARKYEGTGLGLPITKALVELHGGDMRIRSMLGAGTTVTIVFPAQRVIGNADFGS